MRVGMNDAGFIGTDAKRPEEIIAVSLGGDRVAEHEWGIKDLLRTFEVKKKLGLNSYKITTNAAWFRVASDIEVEGKKLNLLIITSAERYFEKPGDCTSFMEKKFHDDDFDFDFWTAWDGKDFILIMTDTFNSHMIFDTFEDKFRGRDIAIFTSGRKNPFASGGLTLAIFSRIPKKHIKESEEADLTQQALDKRRGNMPAYKAWKAKKEEWEKAHPGCDTPWDAISFSSASLMRDTGGIGIWLNPEHQSHLNAGWLSDQDIQDWVDGKVGKVIKSQALWDELNWMCTMKWPTLIGYELHLMNLYPAHYLLDKDQVYQPEGPETHEVGRGFPVRLQIPLKSEWENQKLSPEFIKAVEQHIKWKYLDDFETQLRYGEVKDARQIERPRKTVEDEIYGFFECLRKLGLETVKHGASNTPMVRENFAWWKNLLEREALFDFWVKHGLAYEPWVKNGYSEFMKSAFEGYTENRFHDQDEEYKPLKAKLAKLMKQKKQHSPVASLSEDTMHFGVSQETIDSAKE